MKIIEDKDTNFIDPKTDRYISNLLKEAKKQTLDSQTTNILNYVVYLLLNKDFQHILRSFRLCLGFPIDGFDNNEEFKTWGAKFRETVNKFHDEALINEGTKFLLTRIEATLQRKLVDNTPQQSKIVKNISNDAIITTSDYILKFAKLNDTKNFVYWMRISRELLIFNSPQTIAEYLFKWSKVFGSQSLLLDSEGNRGKLTITLYPDTTIKDIEQLINKKRKIIAEEIKKLHNFERDNESKADDIERDYFIYKTYTSHRSTRKRNEEISENVRKEDFVANKAEETLTGSNQKAVTKMEWESMRKVVSRMNKRINNTLSKDKAEIDDWLTPINS